MTAAPKIRLTPEEYLELERAAMKTGKTARRAMQNVHFRSVGEFLDFLPANERRIVLFLREIILESIPGCIEKLSYNVPFYRRNSAICFLWPASVLWGGKKSHTGVRLGFARGHLLTDEDDYLEKGSRKYVYWKDIADIRAIDAGRIRMYVCEAAVLDAELSGGKRTKKTPEP